MGLHEFITDTFAPGWRKYGVFVAIFLFVAGGVALALFHTDKSPIPDSVIQEEMHRPRAPAPSSK